MAGNDDGNYNGRRTEGEYQASGLLPADDFSMQKARLDGLSTVAKSQIDTPNFYGHAQTWLIETHRVEGAGSTGFLQRIGHGPHGPEALRLVIPPAVMRALLRQDEVLVDKARSRAAKRAAATRKARGIEPAFLKGKRKRAKA